MKEETKCYCGHTTRCDCGPETLEETAEKYSLELLEAKTIQPHEKTWIKSMFIHIAKWQQERSYSEEDMKDAYIQGTLGLEYKKNFNESFYKWFKQFKKK